MGAWGQPVMCPANSFITSVAARKGNRDFDTLGVNGLKIRCRYKNWNTAGDKVVWPGLDNYGDTSWTAWS